MLTKIVTTVHNTLVVIAKAVTIACLELKGSYDAISSFPFSLECYKLFVHR